ncbi:MAG: hypothetical protein V1866_00745 [archaeon]
MTNVSKRAKLVFFLAVLSCSLYFALVGLSKAVPTGLIPSFIASDSGPTTDAGSRADLGGTINTLSLDVVSQDQSWKAYVGNITGKMVLRNVNGISIYEWNINSSALAGYIFVSRNGSVNWTLIRCANSSIIWDEQLVLSMGGSSADNLNNTFNFTRHRAMSFTGGISPVNANTCPSTATYVNGSMQGSMDTAAFQEILLTDTTNLVYGTFIDQNSMGFDNNASITKEYDFQFIVGENRSASIGNTYYFYAEISG